MFSKRNTCNAMYITYAPETDMTFIMRSVIDADTAECLSDECLGWIYGRITINDALNMPVYHLKAIYSDVDAPTDKELAEQEEWFNFLWKTVRNYVDKHVQEELQASTMDRLYDDDDFCNALFKCLDGYDVEALLDNELF